jgi:hypothetical protein
METPFSGTTAAMSKPHIRLRVKRDRYGFIWWATVARPWSPDILGTGPFVASDAAIRCAARLLGVNYGP